MLVARLTTIGRATGLIIPRRLLGSMAWLRGDYIIIENPRPGILQLRKVNLHAAAAEPHHEATTR